MTEQTTSGITPPDDAEGLRKRVEAAWNDSEDSCTRCQHCDRQVNAVLAELVEPPGDLREQMAEKLRSFFDDRPFRPLTAGFFEDLAAFAASVRWEDAARLAAENAQLRERLEEAAGNVSAQWEHKVNAQMQRDSASRALAAAEAQVAALQRELAETCAHAINQRTRAEQAERRLAESSEAET